jgi:maleylpyruvate isomerase
VAAEIVDEDFHRDLAWVRAAHDEVLACLDRLPDDHFAGPSRLPGWTRAHVAAHLAHNADGLGNLAIWAATGVETPMYASVESREADIEHSAGKRPADLRALVAKSSTHLVERLDDLTAEARLVEVHGLFPPSFAAGLLPWQRLRESWVHLVDLDADVGFEHLPAPVAAALLDEAAERSHARDLAHSFVLVDAASARRWALGTAADPVILTGALPALVGWLTGRVADAAVESSAGPVPEPPRWP